MDMTPAERQRIADYVNTVLASYPSAADLLPLTAQNCVEGLHDGVLLCYLVNCLSTTGSIIKQSELKRNKATIFHKMDQVNKALNAAKQVGLQIVNVRAEFIVEKRENALLGLFNQITRQKPRDLSAKSTITEAQQEKTVEKVEERVEEQQLGQHYEQCRRIEQIKIAEPIHMPQPVELTLAPESSPAQQITSPAQQIIHLPINQHQSIPPAAQQGYKFDNVIGPQIVVLVGSIRGGSVNHGIIRALEEIKGRKFFENMHFHVPDLSLLPIYNQDIEVEGRVPKTVFDLQEIVRKSMGVLIATPEYNGSLSSVAKNALDWLTRSYFQPDTRSPLEGKKVGVVSASYLTQNQIRDTLQVFQSFKSNIFGNTFYISLKTGAFKMETGVLVDQKQADRLAFWYQDFSHFIMSGLDNPPPLPRFILGQ